VARRVRHLCGPSGAGKTTLLRLLYREDVPTEARSSAAPGDQLAQSLRGGRAAPVDRHRLPGLKAAAGRTVYENVAFVLRVLAPRGARSPGACSTRCGPWALGARPGLSRQLSAGEAQRAALARAIARKPLLLIADEPTAISTRAWRPR